MKFLTGIVLLILFSTAVQASEKVIDTRLVLVVTDRSSNSKIVRSVYAAIGEETLQVIADPLCESPNAVETQDPKKKRVGEVYAFCGAPVTRQKLVLTTCDGLAANCRKLWSGERSELEGNINLRCQKFDSPGVSEFIMGTDAYRLDPTIREFCRNSISLAKDTLMAQIRVLGTSMELYEGIFPAYDNTEDFFERFMTYRDPVGNFLSNAQEAFRR